MKEFYRVFHTVTARGVYSHRKYCDENGIEINKEFVWFYENMLDSHSDSISHPLLIDDFLFESNYKYQHGDIFGFESLNQLKRWFNPEEREMLSKYGFTIMKAEVFKYSIYERQMIIPKHIFIDMEVTDLLRLTEI